ncbi:MAG: hypothetical protein JNL11_17490 [Bdellovibrionaceae bacterium]|nr:hypothetical protein [Pseudobdellovibrionaceae bacterium]
MKVRDIIYRSLRMIGVLASGETPSADMVQDALKSMNAMIDSWKNIGLLLFKNKIYSLSLVNNQQTYTIGTGGDFDVERPLVIHTANYVVNDIEYPIEVITESEWADIPTKNLASELPQKLYYNPKFPLGEINIWPKPTTPGVIKLYVPDPLERFASVNADVEVPPGYEQLLTYGTADEIAPEYGKEITPRQMAKLNGFKADIMRVNTPAVYAECDQTGAGCPPGSYDIYSGRYHR